MKLEKFDRVKDLFSTSKKLSGLYERYKKESAPASCDKHGFAFGEDDRFSVFKCSVNLASWTGFYGSSSCSTLAHIDDKDAQRLLTRALNKHMTLILNTMAEGAMLEAQILKSAAEKELAAAQNLLEQINAEVQS